MTDGNREEEKGEISSLKQKPGQHLTLLFLYSGWNVVCRRSVDHVVSVRART